MKYFLTLTLIIIVNLNCKANENDSLYSVLKQDILKKRVYYAQKEGRIHALKQVLKKTSANNLQQQYDINLDLYDEYRNFQFDSAHVYADNLYNISHALKDVSAQYESKIRLGMIQLSWGMYKEAFDCIEEIDPARLDKETKYLYYELKARAFLHLYYYNTDKFYAAKNQQSAKNALDSALIYSLPNSFESLRFKAEAHTLDGRKDLAMLIYRRLLSDSNLKYHDRAMVANDLSNLSTGKEAVRLVTVAAIYDVRSSTRETLAIFTLAKWLFANGDFDKAEFLLQEAKEQAAGYGNKIHENEIDALLSMLKAKRLISNETQKNHTLSILIFTLVIMIASTVSLAIFLFVKLKHVKTRESAVNEKNLLLDNLNKSLSEEGKIKEEYIGYFFNIISGYIQRLEKIKRNAEHSYKVKSFAEVQGIIKDIDIRRERDDMFYRFDSLFLKLFPNFVTSFNALMNEKDQIWPKANQVLNTNLRIFALIRLGIRDTQMIANIMENSVSTIYTYKTKIKAKAKVPPDEFDRKIMEINFGFSTK